MHRTSGLSKKTAAARCYCVTVFTYRLRENVDFYTRLLGGKIISERTDRYCDILIGGLPISFRACGQDEVESHFHLYLTFAKKTNLLRRMQLSGVIVRCAGPYLNVLDPDGRMIKLSEQIAMIG